MYYNSQQSRPKCFAKKCYSLILGLCHRRTAAALFLYTVYNRQCLLARPRGNLWTQDMLQGHLGKVKIILGINSNLVSPTIT